MFNHSKYVRVYHKIIDNARERGTGDEKHHIIPKSCGGNDVPKNIILLTYREHFIVHRILPKILISNTHRNKMLQAVYLMSVQTKYVSGRDYANYRTYHINNMKSNNPMFNPDIVRRQVAGRTHDQSAVVKKRNKIYWSDPVNRKALGDRNRKRTIERGKLYVAERDGKTKSFYTMLDLSEYTGIPKGSVHKYVKTGREHSTGWIISRLGNKVARPQLL